MDGRTRGLTLIELLTCLALLALLASLSAPALREGLRGQESETATLALLRALNLARAGAVTGGATVTLCRSRDGMGCGGRWEEGWIVFSDRNGDRSPEGADGLLLRQEAPHPGLSIRFRSFGNRQYLQFTPEGFTRGQNGNFTICAAGLDPRHARQIIISRSGRARLAADLDGDGIREDSQGRPLTCP